MNGKNNVKDRATRVEVNDAAVQRKVFETASTVLCWALGQQRWKMYGDVQSSVPAMHSVAFDYYFGSCVGGG